LKALTIKEVQKIVNGWINQFEESYWPPLSMLASLVEEVGELERLIIKKKLKRNGTGRRYRIRARRCFIQFDLSSKSL